MKKIVSLLILGFLIISCTTEVGHDANDFNMYNYYLTDSSFEYFLHDTATVTLVPPHSSNKFTSQDHWKYQHFIGYYYDERHSVIKSYTYSSSFNDSIVILTDEAGRPYSVRLEGLGYSAIYQGIWDDSYQWDTTTILDPFPLPHTSSIPPAYLQIYILMSDGSSCYRIGERIYSTRYGFVGSENSCLLEYNSIDYTRIGLTPSEFIEKETRWLQ